MANDIICEISSENELICEMSSAGEIVGRDQWHDLSKRGRRAGGKESELRMLLKADKTYVDSQDALKADVTALTALANLVPSATGLTTVTGKNQYYPIVEDNTGANYRHVTCGRRLASTYWECHQTQAANGFGHAQTTHSKRIRDAALQTTQAHTQTDSGTPHS